MPGALPAMCFFLLTFSLVPVQPIVISGDYNRSRQRIDVGRQERQGNMSLSPPFPPYTATSLIQRFPNDQAAQHRIAALQAWLVDRVPLATLTATGPSQATLYRLRQAWKNKGLYGLLTPITSRAVPPDASIVQTLLGYMRKRTTFALGCCREARLLLPQLLDPADCGQVLMRALSVALHETDTLFLAARGFPRLLERRFLHGEPIANLARLAALSQSSLYRLLDHSYALIAERLPALLEQGMPSLPDPLLGRTVELATLEQLLIAHGLVQVLGLPGTGKTALATTLAAHWSQAGWNVISITCDPIQPDPVAALIASLHAQLADRGALATARPDPASLRSEQLEQVLSGLSRLPILLLIDDIYAYGARADWLQLLHTLCCPSPQRHILTIGRFTPLHNGAPTLWLEGLASDAARTFYAALSSNSHPGIWPEIYAETGGNPVLLRAWASSPSSEQFGAAVRALFAPLLHRLRREERHLLAGLAAASEGVRGEHHQLHLFEQHAAYQQLLHQGLLIDRAGQLLMPSLLQRHLRTILPANEWGRVQRVIG